MSDADFDPPLSPPADPPALPPPAAAPARSPAPPRNGASWAWLLWLVVLAAAGYLFWRLQHVEQDQDRAATDERSTLQQLRDHDDALTRDLATQRRDTEALRARLDDAGKVNESLRAQVLGLTERARVAEDAIASLADKRLTGHDSLLLNEAELLLVLGAERLRLFHDPAAAIAAYRLADAALAEANNAAFATIRQSIAAELAALAAIKPVDATPQAEQLSTLRAQLGQLAPLAAPAEPADADASRFRQFFGQFIRVSRDADLRALVARDDPVLARALVDADLREAQSALLARDAATFRRALPAARAHLVGAFDTHAGTGASVLAGLDALATLDVAPAAPEVIGAALRELRNLRATQNLHAPAAPTTAPAPAVPPAQT